MQNYTAMMSYILNYTAISIIHRNICKKYNNECLLSTKQHYLKHDEISLKIV